MCNHSLGASKWKDFKDIISRQPRRDSSYNLRSRHQGGIRSISSSDPRPSRRLPVRQSSVKTTFFSDPCCIFFCCFDWFDANFKKSLNGSTNSLFSSTKESHNYNQTNIGSEKIGSKFQKLMSGVTEAGILESGITESGVTESGVIECGIIESGIIESGIIESGIIESGVMESGILESGVIESGFTEFGVTRESKQRSR